MRFYGIHKLTEECGELLTALGKLQVYPEGQHPDGKGEMLPRVTDELADVLASITYFVERNNLPHHLIYARQTQKLQLYRDWETIT